MSFFRSLLGKKPFVGVDIGTASLKVAEIRREGEKFFLDAYGILETYGYLERFNEAIQTSNLKLSEREAASQLRLLLERAEVKTKTAIASVPAFAAFTTLIEAPEMSESETRNFIELQAKQYIPLPLSAVAFDWARVGRRTDVTGVERQQLLLISVPNEHIERYRKLFKLAGLELHSIELEGIALARSLTAALTEPTLIIDIGARSTSFSVAERGLLKLSGQTDFAGASVTQSIAGGLGISFRRAEDLKKQRELLGFSGSHELSTLIEPMLDVIISEARRVLASFESGYQGKVTSALLSGGGVNLLGIEDYVKGQLGIPVKKANPFPQVSYHQGLEPIVKDTGPLLSVAIGLGIKGFI